MHTDSINGLTDEQKKALDDLETLFKKAKKKQLNFLLVGRTGVGKSSTINSLLGQKIAPEGKYEPTTLTIEKYHAEIGGIRFNIIDTPGLCDDLPERGNDYDYLQLIKQSIPEGIDCMWFVTPLDETRIRSDEMRGVELISKAFGVEVWKHSIIVFTFADKADDYHDDLLHRTALIRNLILKSTGNSKIADAVPAVAVSNRDEKTPDGNLWLGELYTKVFSRISGGSLATFLFATTEFIRPVKENEDARIVISEDQIIEMRETVSSNSETASMVTAFATVGAGIGAVVGPMGMVIGAGIGAGAAVLAKLLKFF